MLHYKREFDIYKRAQEAGRLYFPHFGVNKRQQVTRLLYEISKREAGSPETILRDKNLNSFIEVKKSLLKRRFPYACAHSEMTGPYLPKIEFRRGLAAKIRKKNIFYPKRIFIEKAARDSSLAKRFCRSFPKAESIEIRSLKEHVSGKDGPYSIKDYNRRCDTVFIVNERRDFFKECPCTKGARGCGYHIFNLAFGCIYECVYCYLQEYSNGPDLIFPANLGGFFDRFSSYKRPGMRIGTGEFSDSLMLDDLTEYSASLVDFFGRHQGVTFELKTKSANIGNLLKIKHAGNCVVSWSLNPQKIIDENEFYTATLTERLNSAARCARAGYRVGFHFDPVIYYKDWHKAYLGTVEMLFDKIKPQHIAWISIGTLRFNPRLKKIMEMRFPGAKLLDGELLPGYDNKLRYPCSIRRNVYETMIKTMRKHCKKLPIYLCMEEGTYYGGELWLK